jgi:hypothetical protein
MAVRCSAYILFYYQGITRIHTDIQNHGHPAIMDSDFSHINHFPNPFLQYSVSILSMQQRGKYYLCFFRKLYHVVVVIVKSSAIFKHFPPAQIHRVEFGEFKSCDAAIHRGSFISMSNSDHSAPQMKIWRRQNVTL